MTAIVSELLRAALTIVLFLFTLQAGRRFGLAGDPGWRLITAGFGMLVFATVWDATDNFDSLSAYTVIGSTPAQTVLEKIVGYLGGFILLFVGFLRWLPLVGETKAARRELATLNQELETRVAERTAELEEANRAKSDFLSRMSHELRTPLNAIIGLSEITAKEVHGPPGSPRYAENAQLINGSGHHLLGMVEEILDIAKIEAGRMQLEEAPLDLPAVAEEAISMLRLEADRAGIALEMRHESPPRLFADEQRIRQILINLISNALKFTPSGGRVVLSVGLDRDGQPWLQVTDTGIGISAEDLDRVREPFVQGTQLAERKSPGTGLGLMLVEQLAKLHGGSFTLESEPGDGTTATVTLPAVRVIAEDAAPLNKPGAARLERQEAPVAQHADLIPADPHGGVQLTAPIVNQ